MRNMFFFKLPRFFPLLQLRCKQVFDLKTINQPLQVRLDVFAVFLWILFLWAVITIMSKWTNFFTKYMPYWKARYWQEKIPDFFIIVTTADRNLIYKNKAKTSSLTWRGCVMIFEQETCLHVSSTPKP